MSASAPARRTRRWYGISAVSLCCIGTGVLLSAPGLVLAGVVTVGVAFADRIDSPPAATVEITRSLSPADPVPGEPVTVTLAVTNVGDSVCFDLRVVDGVPKALSVIGGTSRLAQPLAPGQTATTEYTLEADRGVHEFEDCTVITANATGTIVRQRSVAATTNRPITAIPSHPQPVAVSLYRQAIGGAGRISTDAGGSGTEFHSVREYRHGDPPSRIDWNRNARTGELSTIEYVQERSTTVVLVIDAREQAYCSGDPHGRTALERSIEGAHALAAGLLQETNPVGVGSFSPNPCWLEPGTGDDQRSQLREVFGTAVAFSPTPPTEPYLPVTMLRRLRHRLPVDAQVILCTPLVDDYPALAARRLQAHGYPTTILSPALGDSADSPEDDPRVLLSALERAERIRSLRNDGVRCIDWDDDSLQLSVDRARQRWSR